MPFARRPYRVEGLFSLKSWADRLPQEPFPYRALPADGRWTTQEDAAVQLGIGLLRVGWLVANRHLDAVRTTTPGQLAVSRAGIEAERRWRATASSGPCRHPARSRPLLRCAVSRQAVRVAPLIERGAPNIGR